MHRPPKPLEILIYDSAGELVHSATLPRSQARMIGGRLSYEYTWDASGAGTGIYAGVVVAKREGLGSLKKTAKVAVVK